MANKLALGLVIGGAVSSTVGSAFKDVTSRIKRLETEGKKSPGAGKDHWRHHAVAR